MKLVNQKIILITKDNIDNGIYSKLLKHIIIYSSK